MRPTRRLPLAWLSVVSSAACGRVGVELIDQPDLEGAVDADADGAGPGDAGGEDAAAVDAGGRDAGTDAGIACSGEVVLGLCWYLGAAGDSCNQTCSSHGGFDTRTASYVGTTSQGGSQSECMQLIAVLWGAGTVGEGMRADSNGFGCHVWTDGALWWLATPSFTPNVSGTGIRVVCACTR